MSSPSPARAGEGGLRNGLWSVASTATSGLSNLFVQLLVAALVSAGDFGRFALVSSTILIVVALARTVIAQTDMLRGDRGPDAAPAGAAWLLALLALAVGLPIALVAAALDVPLISTLGTAIALSGVFVLQDAARFRCFRMHRAGLALVSDTVVLVVAVGGLAGAAAAGAAGALALWVWAAATALGFAVIGIPIRYVPALREGRRWLRSNRDLVVPGLGEYTLQTGLPYALMWGVLALGGLPAVAGYRLVQLLFGAVSNLAQGLNAATLPGIVNSLDPVRARTMLRSEQGVSLAAALLLLAAALALPAQWGTVLFGGTWLAAAAFLVPGFVHGLANALTIPDYSALRLLGFARFSFGVRVVSVVATVPLAIIGALTLGAPGLAWAIAITALVAWVARTSRVNVALARLIRTGSPIAPRAVSADL